jgi:radical SAM-linked protein
MPALINGIRIRFTKEENVKFMSHLDTLKLFERALRRAAIHITHSQGFNPHAHMVFGLPLQVGVTSDAEYADFEFGEDAKVTPEEFMNSLNKVLPDGITVKAAARMSTKSNIMSCIAMAGVHVTVRTDAPDFVQAVTDFHARNEIMVERTTKNGTRTVDIRPMIAELSCTALGGNKYLLSMKLDAGSVSNLKADTVIDGLRDHTDHRIDITGIHRTDLYVRKNDRLLDPLSDEALLDN